MEPIRITHFSDVLCVWAYVSQVRMDELRKTFDDRIEIEYRFVSVFGDTEGKIARVWGERGGAPTYSAHVREIVERFGHVPVHSDIWTRDAPRSSMPAHLMLCAARIIERESSVRGSGGGEAAAGAAEPGGPFERAAWAVRQTFFRDLVDVSRRDVLLRIAADAGLDAARIEELLDSGRAHAALADDLDRVREHAIQASPTLVFNEGRQRLTGNVGYRIIEANVRELIERPPDEQTWC